ncbi:hypothetical protein CR983_03095 [Candidatus Saccharibacteria bacterium]|nr:MAG: hypothetical protein CR983_03095 [Candidatus Saccharibacteria bacterium]
MYRSSSRIFPAIILTLVVVALIIGLVIVGRSIFGATKPETEETEGITPQEELLTVNASRAVRMTIRGPIVADEEFRSYRVSVSPNARKYTVYKGYLDGVQKQRAYDNNTQAYEEFVYALDKAALTKKGRYTEEEASDIRGICATGRVYEYELLDGSSVLQRYWTSTCKGSPGTLGASADQLTALFTAQIPDKVDYKKHFGGGLSF